MAELEPLDLDAFREWKGWPEERRQLYLHNAFCSTCSKTGAGAVTSFAQGYTIKKDDSCLIVVGKCYRCGERIARVCD